MRLPTALVSLCLAAGLIAAAPSAAQAIDPSKLIPPVAYPDAASAVEGHSVAITAAQLLGNDVSFNGSALAIASVTSPSHGTLVVDSSGGGWSATYTSMSGNTEDDAFTYTLVNGYGVKSAPATVTIAITPNGAPVVTPASMSIQTGDSLTVDPVILRTGATDPEGDPIWVDFTTGAGHGTFTAPGKWNIFGSYVSDPGFVGTDHVGYVVNDQYGKSTPAVLTIKVLPVPVSGPVLVSAHGLKAKAVRVGHRGRITGTFGTHAGTVQVRIKAPGVKAKTFQVVTAATGQFRLVVPGSLAKRAGKSQVSISYVADATSQGARSYSLSYLVKNGK